MGVRVHPDRGADDERKPVHGGEGHREPEAARGRRESWRALSPTWDQRGDPLKLEGQIRGDFGVEGAATEGSKRGDPEAEEAAGRSDARQRGAQGHCVGKLLKPAARRRTVHHTMTVHGLS